MSPPNFTFDRRLQRYRYTSGDRNGQFIARSKISGLIEAHINQLENDADTITDLLIEGKIGVGAWEEAIALTLKRGHILSYTLGKGGAVQLNQGDYGRIGQVLRGEYGFLRGFSKDILEGKLSEAQIRDRARRYFGRLHSSYEMGRLQAHREAGYLWEKRLRSARESCASCVRYESQGWVVIGSLPAPGYASECGGNCRCTKRFSKETTKPQDGILRRSFGWIGRRAG